MTPLYQLLVFLHVVAALVWIGGLFFMAGVGAPVLRTVEPVETRVALFRALGLRLRWVGWGALLALLLTGTGILHLRGWLQGDLLGDPAWWGSPVGRALGWKLAMVGVMVILALGHDLLEGRRDRRGGPGHLGPRPLSDPGGPEPGSTQPVAGASRVAPAPSWHRPLATWMARGSAGAALLLVYWAMRLARGG